MFAKSVHSFLTLNLTNCNLSSPNLFIARINILTKIASTDRTALFILFSRCLNLGYDLFNLNGVTAMIRILIDIDVFN